MKQFRLSKGKMWLMYGPSFSKRDLLLTYSTFITAIILMCFLHQLRFIYALFIILSGFICLPLVIRAYLVHKREKKIFEEYCLYFEHMKMYFKVYQKINTALSMTYSCVNPTSKLGQHILQAMEEIDKSADYDKALSVIEKAYENSYLKRLHALLITAEKQGKESILFNLDHIPYKDWKEDIQLLQKKKKRARYMFYFISCICLGMSVYSIMIYQGDQMFQGLIKNNEYQFYTFLELQSLLLIFIYIYCTLVNKKWVRGDE